MYRHRGVRHDGYAGNSGHGGHIGHTLVILVHDDDGCHVERGGDCGHDGTHVGGWDCVANQFIYFMQKACFFRFQSVISSKHVCAPCLFSTRRSWTMMLEFLYHSTIVDLSKMIFNMASIFITVRIIR